VLVSSYFGGSFLGLLGLLLCALSQVKVHGADTLEGLPLANQRLLGVMLLVDGLRGLVGKLIVLLLEFRNVSHVEWMENCEQEQEQKIFCKSQGRLSLSGHCPISHFVSTRLIALLVTGNYPGFKFGAWRTSLVSDCFVPLSAMLGKRGVVDNKRKAEEINLVLNEKDVDLWRLRELALSDGGLVNGKACSCQPPASFLNSMKTICERQLGPN